MKFTGEYFVPGRAPFRVQEDHLNRYRFAAQFVRNKAVLDVACGVGYGAQLLAETGATRVDAVDIAEDLVSYARSNYSASNLTFYVGDICSFAGKAPYDLIVCFETIEHVGDYQVALANLYQLLLRGGSLLISTPNRLITSPHAQSIDDPPGNMFHVREFSLSELVSALDKTGFEVTPAGIFGQRQQFYIHNRILRKIYHRIFNPNLRTSSTVLSVNRLQPRYLVVLAHKPL